MHSREAAHRGGLHGFRPPWVVSDAGGPLRALMFVMLLTATAQAAEVPQCLPAPLTQKTKQAEPLDYVDTRSPDDLLKAAPRGNRITLIRALQFHKTAGPPAIHEPSLGPGLP